MDGANKAIFLSTSPLRGTTMFGLGLYIYAGISIHVPLAGDDKSALRGWLRLQYFYPRPPCGGRPQTVRRQSLCTTISIHVPLAGDDILSTSLIGIARISIHVPLAGDDRWFRQRHAAVTIFLSTSPLRGTTVKTLLRACFPVHFYPRPPCGGRPCGASCATPSCRFLSTSPLRGTTVGAVTHHDKPGHFYPRPPCGGRHVHRPAGHRQLDVSIHVPLAGDDPKSSASASGAANFYPRPPCGGRRAVEQAEAAFGQISIHVPLAGDDPARR